MIYTCILETEVVWNTREIKDYREINSSELRSWQRKGSGMSKSKSGPFFSFHLLRSKFWKWKHLCLVVYAACGSLMTALLKKPSELEIENNDYRAEDVIQRSKSKTCKPSASKWNAIFMLLLKWIQCGIKVICL